MYKIDNQVPICQNLKLTWNDMQINYIFSEFCDFHPISTFTMAILNLVPKKMRMNLAENLK